MAEEDYSVNKLMRNSVRFADLYNGTVFRGKQVLKPEDLSDVPDENGIAIVGLDGKRRLIRRSRDVIKKASFGAYFVLLAEENQDKVHYAMPVRSMLYDALEYTEQVEALKRRHRECGDRLEGDAFLSGINQGRPDYAGGNPDRIPRRKALGRPQVPVRYAGNGPGFQGVGGVKGGAPGLPAELGGTE